MAGTICRFARIPCKPCTAAPAYQDTSNGALSNLHSYLAKPVGCNKSARGTGKRHQQTVCKAQCEEQPEGSGRSLGAGAPLSRRHAISLAAASATLAIGASTLENAEAVQGMVAGRLPGLGPEDADGETTYGLKPDMRFGSVNIDRVKHA
jgi:hypothetical protein